MDQWTQVNFPAPSRYPRKRLRRHNTTADLQLSPPRSLQASPSSFWMQNVSLPSVAVQPRASPRPRSLHLSAETFQKARPAYGATESVPSRLSHSDVAEELTLKAIPSDHTPPYSSSSSLINTGGCGGRKLFSHGHAADSQHFLRTPDCAGTCRCFYRGPEGGAGGAGSAGGGDRSKPRVPSVTPEGLSWRRLHMSRAKLKATSTTSELLSGFAMVAMVELQINEDTAVPEWLFVMFSVCTTVLVAVHIFALMISTYILPNIDAISKLDVCELVTESPHERMKGFIELAWAFSTVLGLFLFLVEVAILCWVKFWDYSFTAAIAATVIVIPVLVIFVLFAVHFYHSLVVYRCDTSVGDMQKLEDMKRHLDEAASPV